MFARTLRRKYNYAAALHLRMCARGARGPFSSRGVVAATLGASARACDGHGRRLLVDGRAGDGQRRSIAAPSWCAAATTAHVALGEVVASSDLGVSIQRRSSVAPSSASRVERHAVLRRRLLGEVDPPMSDHVAGEPHGAKLRAALATNSSKGSTPAVGAIRSVAVDKGASAAHAQIQGCAQAALCGKSRSSGKSLNWQHWRLRNDVLRIRDAETREQLSSVPFLQ